MATKRRSKRKAGTRKVAKPLPKPETVKGDPQSETATRPSRVGFTANELIDLLTRENAKLREELHPEPLDRGQMRRDFGSLSNQVADALDTDLITIRINSPKRVAFDVAIEGAARVLHTKREKILAALVDRMISDHQFLAQVTATFLRARRTKNEQIEQSIYLDCYGEEK